MGGKSSSITVDNLTIQDHRGFGVVSSTYDSTLVGVPVPQINGVENYFLYDLWLYKSVKSFSLIYIL